MTDMYTQDAVNIQTSTRYSVQCMIKYMKKCKNKHNCELNLKVTMTAIALICNRQNVNAFHRKKNHNDCT